MGLIKQLQGRVHILMLTRTSAYIREFELFDGLKETKLIVDVPEGHSFKVQNLSLDTFYCPNIGLCKKNSNELSEL